MKRLVLCGSPRAMGRSSALADAVVRAYEAQGDEVELVALADVSIASCMGCDACERNGRTPGRDPLYCVISDDMARVRACLNACEALSVVSPVYFAGAPSQLKAFFDRLQPYFWTRVRFGAKRPAELFVVGEGGDPHGFAPLVGTARSALAVAGFSFETVHDWVGLVGVDGSLGGADALTGGRVHPAAAYVCAGPDGFAAAGPKGASEAIAERERSQAQAFVGEALAARSTEGGEVPHA